jgi:hypothetical protein
MGQREPKVRKRALRAITGRPEYALGSPESGRRPPLIFKKNREARWPRDACCA